MSRMGRGRKRLIPGSVQNQHVKLETSPDLSWNAEATLKDTIPDEVLRRIQDAVHRNRRIDRARGGRATARGNVLNSRRGSCAA